jgi:hypothetical protein
VRRGQEHAEITVLCQNYATHVERALHHHIICGGGETKRANMQSVEAQRSERFDEAMRQRCVDQELY